MPKDQCYFCGISREIGGGKEITIDESDPEIGINLDPFDVWVCGLCEGSKDKE